MALAEHPVPAQPIADCDFATLAIDLLIGIGLFWRTSPAGVFSIRLPSSSIAILFAPSKAILINAAMCPDNHEVVLKLLLIAE